jgi:hypothetical protein
MGRLPNRLPAVRAVWLHNEVPARRILAVAWLERGASVPRAANLPCAYTDLATCPLPPAGNRVPVAVEAGEKIPYERR